ncbi:MAG: hypothetical protein JXA18_06570 [Chitinispirillaceae bacterium]|nr:hypothetical protein [Chitinispirillaceae bacterium]
MIEKIAVIICFFMTTYLFGSQRVEIDSIAGLIREYVLIEKPSMNPSFQVVATEYVIDDLFDSLGIQIVHAEYVSSDGDPFDNGEYIYYHGSVYPFAASFGGLGLLSGLVIEGKLFYTYSFGSGIKRSHIGVLFFNEDTLVIRESGGFKFNLMDLFIAECTSGVICIYLGRKESYYSFNSWTDSVELGWQIAIEESGLVVFDSTGAEIEPDFKLSLIEEDTRNILQYSDRLKETEETFHYSDRNLQYLYNLKGQIIRNRFASLLLIDNMKTVFPLYKSHH